MVMGLGRLLVCLRETRRFGVDSLDEALEIRDMRVDNPILILGYIPQRRLRVAIDNDVSFIVYDLQTLDAIKNSRSSCKAKIHLKIETGTNRQGLQIGQLNDFVKKLRQHNKHIELKVSIRI